MNYDFLQSYNIPISAQGSNYQYGSSNPSKMEGAYGTYALQSAESTPKVNTEYYGYGGRSNLYSNSSYQQTRSDDLYNNSSYQSTSSSNLYNSSSYQPTGSSSLYSNSNYQSTGNASLGEYKTTERFIPPYKQNMGYTSYKNPFKRKLSAASSGGSSFKKESHIEEVTADGKLAMFMGRDESYPDDLNAVIHPLSCDLCKVKFNSRILAKNHYESKSHDKHVSNWLSKNFTEKGITPPVVKRFVKQGSAGPDAYYCEVCDLKLTSLTHANQHYAGKKHGLVVSQRGKPSGAGFYNTEGKWVRTGTKATPKTSKDNSFGIGESFRYAEMLASVKGSENLPSTSNSTTITSAADTTTNTNKNKSKLTVGGKTDQDPALFCSICKISVTSAVQMKMHLSGSKHVKNQKLSGVDPSPPTDNSAESSASVIDNVLLSAIKEEITPDPSDLSNYRTPSGQYYCKTCNTSLLHLNGLEQHLVGKRHLKKLTEEKAKASLATKKN